MADLTRIANHVEDAIEKLVGTAWRKPNIEALLTAYVSDIQTLEDELFLYWQGRTLELAIGSHLEVIGSLVDEARNGATDSEYRDAIRLKILVLKSFGTVTGILKIMTAISPDLTKWIYFELGTAAFRIETYGLSNDPFIARILKKAKLAGVGLDYAASSSATLLWKYNSRQGGVTAPGTYDSRQGGTTDPSLLAHGYR